MTQFLLLFGSVIGGALLGIIMHKRTQQSIKYLLAFSGAYLFGISVVHLFPEVFLHVGSQAGLWILIGFFAQILLEFFSKGLEHGHMHHHGPNKQTIPMVIALWIHAFLEGMPIGGHAHIHQGIMGLDPLMAGVIMHKIPIGMIVMIFLLDLKTTNFYRWLGIITFALAAPLGSLLANQVALFTDLSGPLMAFVLGMFLHISTTILFENADSHNFNRNKLAVVIIGASLAWLTAA